MVKRTGKFGKRMMRTPVIADGRKKIRSAMFHNIRIFNFNFLFFFERKYESIARNRVMKNEMSRYITLSFSKRGFPASVWNIRDWFSVVSDDSMGVDDSNDSGSSWDLSQISSSFVSTYRLQRPGKGSFPIPNGQSSQAMVIGKDMLIKINPMMMRADDRVFILSP